MAGVFAPELRIAAIVAGSVPRIYGSAHRLEITMGSLYPPPGSDGLRRLVRVRLDGKTVLQGESDCHPAAPNQIHLLANPIGGSTCGPQFNGSLVAFERPTEPRN